MILYLDLECYSATPIRHGVYRYAEDSEILLVAWAIDDGEVMVDEWRCCPEFKLVFQSADEIVAHNAMFDRVVLEHHGFKREIEAWRCTMAQAMAHSLPGKLETLCAVLNVPLEDAKHEGKHLVQLFCKPRPKNSKVERATKETHPEEWAAFVAYAGNDVRALRHLQRRLPTWNYRDGELDIWRLDQRINDRGVAVDVGLSRAAIEATDRIQKSLSAQAHDATEGALDSTTQRDKLLAHILSHHGVALPDMKASTLERRLDDPELPAPVRELIALRLEASLTSGTKHKALLNAVSSDGRLRGMMRFCGASRTGRWSGQVVQLQNLPRPPKYLSEPEEYDDAIEIIKTGAVDLVYEKPLEVISGTVRGALVPAPGKKFVIADLAAIEGRVLAWLAGEQWKLDAYAAGEDLYKLAYAKTFGLDVALITKSQRQVGKILELALGYQGAVGAFSTMAALYGVDLPEAEVVKLVKAWRKANSRISTFWYEMEDAAKHAITHPGTLVTCRRLKLQRDGAWLRVRLPSGRYLCYPHARLDLDGKLCYQGTNQYTRQWGKIKTYGGKLVENATQAVARDVMAANMPRIETAGFEIVLSVHDELVTESASGTGVELAELLSAVPAWAGGLPLGAEGFETMRYRK